MSQADAHNLNHEDQYHREFVDYWDELVGWEGRARSEGDFYEHLITEQGGREVADVACGTGFNSIQLARAGLVVTATDGSPNMIAKTRANAKTHGVSLAKTQVVDWTTVHEQLGEARFDALICLGNSFTHLFEHEPRVAAVRSFYRALRPGGVLILDHRNYDTMLDEGFSTSHQHCYTGDGVQAYPVDLHDGLARFEYKFPDGAVFNLNMFPLRRGYVTGLLQDAGFVDLRDFGDYRADYELADADFIQQVARKPA